MSKKIKDYVFPKYLISSQIDLCENIKQEILEYDVVRQDKRDQSYELIDNTFYYSNPNSIFDFLCFMLHTCLSPHASNEQQRDKIAVMLYCLSYNYIYQEEDRVDVHCLLLSFEKFKLPTLIIKEILEPIIGKIDLHQVLYIKSDCLDSVDFVESSDELTKEYNVDRDITTKIEYPIFVVNSNIKNYGSVCADLLYMAIKAKFGHEMSQNIVKNILTDTESDLFERIIDAAKLLYGDTEFIDNFISYAISNIDYNHDNIVFLNELKEEYFEKDPVISNNIKIAKDGMYDDYVRRQWIDWGLLDGITEKRLGPFWGSTWPTTKVMKPHDDHRENVIKYYKKKKNKKNLNLEELLAAAREVYNTKNKQPGKLLNQLLDKVRNETEQRN